MSEEIEAMMLYRMILLAGIMMGVAQPAYAGWEVQWIDRFDGSGVDWSAWTPQTKANYNNEVQCYTSDDYSDLRNYEVSDGTLKIISHKKTHNCMTLGGQQRTWTSGRINTKDKQEFLYGRVEARIRFHNLEAGTWPAFWMLENRIFEQPIKGDGDSVNWPLPGAGEIDVWEWFANQPDVYITNFYNANSCGHEVRYPYPNGRLQVKEWHQYAMEWTHDDIRFFVNDTLVAAHDVSQCPQYKEPMFVLLNLAMGGNLGGNIDPDLSTAKLEIDYVAHCQKSETSSAEYCNEQTPVSDNTSPDPSLPDVYLTMQQDGKVTSLVDPENGIVTLIANLELADGTEEDYSLIWQSQALPSPETRYNTLVFDPSSMIDGTYRVEVALRHNSNSALSAQDDIEFQVMTAGDIEPAPHGSSDSSGGSSGLFILLSLFGCALLRQRRR
ncbi:glycoside hydrolase family 16 protein [Vibrio methylphosphonaticus]|uniref:glycoside hydrolase family 16 protein n=1 Tax=Vibrio methylphosphonaticus TaxID=2946866 RepID=UPI00202A490D|nr:glycoside hydrolase family 16 protein [Vibrio methylphosphonaticus]MCL9774086.1 glycoside hydrolase family 16 protein [Vibrio methylphosphonaticus]